MADASQGRRFVDRDGDMEVAVHGDTGKSPIRTGAVQTEINEGALPTPISTIRRGTR